MTWKTAISVIKTIAMVLSDRSSVTINLMNTLRFTAHGSLDPNTSQRWFDPKEIFLPRSTKVTIVERIERGSRRCMLNRKITFHDFTLKLRVESLPRKSSATEKLRRGAKNPAVGVIVFWKSYDCFAGTKQIDDMQKTMFR